MGLQEKVGSELFLSEPCDPKVVAEKLRVHFPHLSVESRCRFRVASSIAPSLYANTKKTTIRFSRNAVEYPVSDNLPVFEDHGGSDPYLRPIGCIRIMGLRYKLFGTLNDVDAALDGFETANELKLALNEFYGRIDDAEVVSIYVIHHEAWAA